MKMGVRKPNIKSRVKARTTAKVKRSIKKSVNPLYGKKGMGYINDPKKAVYNKVYNKTTVSVDDLIKSNSSHSSRPAAPTSTDSPGVSSLLNRINKIDELIQKSESDPGSLTISDRRYLKCYDISSAKTEGWRYATKYLKYYDNGDIISEDANMIKFSSAKKYLNIKYFKVYTVLFYIITILAFLMALVSMTISLPITIVCMLCAILSGVAGTYYRNISKVSALLKSLSL